MSALNVLRAAAGEIGYAEIPPNKTKYGEWYGMDYNPWCDMFVSWAAAKAGEGKTVGKFASTRAHWAWLVKNGTLVTTPRLGDIVFYAWDGGGVSGIDHIGYVERWWPGDPHPLQTVEGNTSTGGSAEQIRNGGGVLRVRRTMFAVAGFLRPNYAPEPVKVVPKAPLKDLYPYPGLIARGSRNEVAVKRVQRVVGVIPDGDFGPKTLLAVKRFQSTHHLEVDGVVGRITWGVMF